MYFQNNTGSKKKSQGKLEKYFKLNIMKMHVSLFFMQLEMEEPIKPRIHKARKIIQSRAKIK
jgi:hypothetical protein